MISCHKMKGLWPDAFTAAIWIGSDTANVFYYTKVLSSTSGDVWQYTHMRRNDVHIIRSLLAMSIVNTRIETLLTPRIVFSIMYIKYPENWTLTALQRRRIESAEMKLLRPLARYTLYNHKTKDSVRRELQTECILNKTDEYRRNWLLHLQRMLQNRIPLK
jgi:hypothetical protein